MIVINCNRDSYAGDLTETARLFDAQGRAVCGSALEPGDMRGIVTLSVDGENVRADAVAWNEPDGERSEASVSLPMPKEALQRKKIEKRVMKLALYRALQQARPTPLPWGALTGIRPTKLYRELIALEGVKKAKRVLTSDFDVSWEKLRLVEDVLRVQRGLLEYDEGVFDAYIGIPFCLARCRYCAFTSYGLLGADLEGYLAALKREIQDVARLAEERGLSLRCLYVGGGTPTAITPEQLADVLQCARALGAAREITVEAGRPDTISPEHLLMLKHHGVSRISINPQSMNAQTLARIGRAHSPEDVEAAMDLARRVGFDWINMDIIVGLPGETEAMTAHTLERINALRPENLTVHTLAIKRSSALAGEDMRAMLPEAGAAENMLAMCHERARSMGLEPYYLYRQKYMAGHLENVGYALPGKICRYNVDIMEETTSVLAMGAGAISKWVTDGGRRIERAPNPKDLATYKNKIALLDSAKRAMMKEKQ